MNRANLHLQEKSWTTKIFWLLMILHLTLWTLLPAIARYAPSNDVIEAINWAQQLTWGYDKNPWVVGWITRLGITISCGNNLAGYYFLQQLLIVFGFWSIWKLANQLVQPVQALFATLIMEGCLYYSIIVQTNNDNFILIALLNFAIYAFFMACEHQKARYWMLTGVSLALALMTKYSSAVLIVPMLIYWLITPKVRQNTSPLGLSGGILLGMLICLPNLIWLNQHDFIALKYLQLRADIQSNNFYTQHFYYSIKFLIQTFYNIAPCLLLLGLIILPDQGKTTDTTRDNEKSIRHGHFLLLIGFVPFLIVLLLAIIFGQKIYWEWGVPFISFWGLIFIYYCNPKITTSKLRNFLIGVISIALLTAGSYFFIETRFSAGSGSADYPADQIADTITKIWHAKFNTKLRYVAGSRYTAGVIAFYSPDKPKVFIEWNPLYSVNFDHKELKKSGAVFVHEGYYGTTVLPFAKDYSNPTSFPKEILNAYPNLIVLPIQSFNYHRNQKTKHQVNLLIGLLPPSR